MSTVARTLLRAPSASLSRTRGPMSTSALLLGLLLLASAGAGSSSYGSNGNNKIPKWSMKIAKEQGPNACVVEEAGGRRFYSDCKYWRQRNICGQPALPRYECCEGFEQLPGEPGCAGVAPLEGVMETARRLGAGRFVRLLERAGVGDDIKNGGAVTLFAPADSALEDLQHEEIARLEQLEDPSTRPTLLYHIADGRVLTTELPANDLLDTRLSGRQVRYNKYSSGVQTVNCVRVIRRDVLASNGVVHLMEGLLDPDFASTPGPRDLAQIVMADGRFTELARAIERAGFAPRLRNAERPCTMLAPSDEAFQKLSSTRLQRIMQDEVARQALLEHHVVPHPLCLPAVLGEHRVRALDGEKLNFDCDARGSTVNGKRLRSEPVLASNGALYMLDDVLLPDRAKSVMQLIDERQLHSFAHVVRTAGLDEAFDSFHDYTVFAPSESAMYGLPETRLHELRTKRDAARDFVMLHATAGRVRWSTVAAGQTVMALDEHHRLRLQMYRRGPGVEAALVEERDVQGLNGCLHVLDRVLEPTNLSARDVLRRDGNFSIFLMAMERSGASMLPATTMSVEGEAHAEGRHFTYFVPTDAAFEQLGENRLSRLMDDPSILSKTLQHHVCEDMLPSAGWTPELRHGVRTRHGDLRVTRSSSGKIKVDEATVVRADVVTTSGVIHVINRVLLPDS